MLSNYWQLVLSLILPYFIVIGIVIKAALPLVTGKPVLLPVEPVDPRDLMRGQYIELAYDFTNLDLQHFPFALTPGREYNFGSTLYLVLQEEAGYAKPIRLQEKKPASGLFLQVRPRSAFSLPEKNAKEQLPLIQLKAGIESFFVDEVIASQLEQESRLDRLAAKVFIAPNGEARVSSLTGRLPIPSQRLPQLPSPPAPP